MYFFTNCVYICIYIYIYIYTEGAVHGDVNFMKKIRSKHCKFQCFMASTCLKLTTNITFDFTQLVLLAARTSPKFWTPGGDKRSGHFRLPWLCWFWAPVVSQFSTIRFGRPMGGFGAMGLGYGKGMAVFRL